MREAERKGAGRLLIYADPAIFSGAESFLVDLARDLSEAAEFEMEAAVPFGNQRLYTELGEAMGRPPAYDVPAQPLRLAALHLPGMGARIRRSLSGCSADVVLLNLPSPEYGPGLLLSGALPDVPKVGLLHVVISMRRMGFRGGWLRDRVALRALGKLDAACLLSSQAERVFREDFDSRGVSTGLSRMPRPSISRQDRGDVRALLGLPERATLIGMAGRITLKQKGQDTFVEAASILADRVPDLGFVVAGEGPDQQRLIGMVRRAGLSDRFHLLGQVGDIGSFLSAIDLIAIPSRFEGLPLIALEALQAGVPGVASGVDGLLDVWPSDWLVPPSDPGSLAERVLSILESDSSRTAQLITEAQRLAARRETEHPGEDVAGLLREMIGDGDQR